MFDIITDIAKTIVCLFKKHSFIVIGGYNYCARCGRLEVRKQNG